VYIIFTEKQITNKILDILYKNNLEEITCDFILNNENKNKILHGKAIITRNQDCIEIIGEQKDYINTISQEDFNDNNVKNIKVSASDMPNYFECILVNFPNEDMKKDVAVMNIEVKFPKVIVSSNFTFSISFRDLSKFKSSIQVLYDQKSRELMSINCW